MNSFKIACRLLKNNRKLYGLYLIVIVSAIATYYNFVAIKYNQNFIEVSERLQTATVASMVCEFVLACTVIFFMWQSNEFFFKHRQKETALYMLMGISSSKVGTVFGIESIILGTFSLGIGIPIGVLFSKLFFMLLGKVMNLGIDFQGSFSFSSLLQVVVVFGIIFIFLFYKNYKVVKKSELIRLLNALNESSEVPKLNYLKGIIGVLLILVGYIIGISIRIVELDLLIGTMSCLILVSIGTYLFFGSFLPIILSKLITNKSILYNTWLIISINDIYFKLKSNYKNLAMTAILATSTVTALTVSLSLKYCADKDLLVESPYSFSYINSYEGIENEVKEDLSKFNVNIDKINKINYSIGNIDYLNRENRIDKSEPIFISYSTLINTLKFLDFDYSNIDEISKSEVLFILSADTISTPINVINEEVSIEGIEKEIANSIRVPIFGNVEDLGSRNIYVFEDSEYEVIKESLNGRIYSGVKINSEEENFKILVNIKDVVKNNNGSIFPKVDKYVWEYYAFKIFFFLGTIMSLIFILATLSTLYFKIIGDVIDERERYNVLEKIGVNKEVITKTAFSKLAIIFLFPVLIGIVHSIVAIQIVKLILNESLVMQSIIGISIFITIITIFYFGIIYNYSKVVYQE
ncbi:ABC transporter permease [Clostridium gasigenes]|uniref:FtsX-like permease family protein n=1 Tax=Clostridium gasigenes TaxID=94869 RepID=UPI0014383EFC|nr:FtsX-like permease family protein [Clostridium gasigenes]NKF08830.1 ABC transporter permease [Clostridium gasigenes]QSW21246.1 ABC transporter permease [Clostridium gasigenes]